MVQGGGLPVPAFTYDGDTPVSVRSRVREQGRIVITNPDMLHTGVLPHHTKWGHFFGGLRFVVIDELHIYRGVFGSHLANVIRRLKRIAAFYGARPRFICCSATIGNPLELARSIIEEDAVLIDRNGAPAGRRHFLLYNPPLLDAEQGIRRSVVNEAHEIATRLLRRRVKTIVFARSRTRTELISTYIRESLGDRTAPDATHAVASYRGGYLPSERRRIERGLRDGSLRGVVSTNALELGIDIGGLDASVMAGFPGTIASCRQQAGRSGRTTDVALSILIATPAPIDQFVIRHPEYLFGTSPESGHVDPDNIHILLDQLKCAVFELPYRDADAGTPHVAELLRYLGEQGVLHHAGGSWYWTDRAYPAEQVSLRTSTAQNVVIVDATGGGAPPDRRDGPGVGENAAARRRHLPARRRAVPRRTPGPGGADLHGGARGGRLLHRVGRPYRHQAAAPGRRHRLGARTGARRHPGAHAADRLPEDPLSHPRTGGPRRHPSARRRDAHEGGRRRARRRHGGRAPLRVACRLAAGAP